MVTIVSGNVVWGNFPSGQTPPLKQCKDFSTLLREVAAKGEGKANGLVGLSNDRRRYYVVEAISQFAPNMPREAIREATDIIPDDVLEWVAISSGAQVLAIWVTLQVFDKYPDLYASDGAA